MTSADKLAANLEKADSAPRCSYIRATGIRCGSPALRGGELCHYHKIASDHATLQNVPALEDGDTLTAVLTQLLQSASSGSLDPKRVWQFVAILQIARATLKHTTTQPALEHERRKELLQLATESHFARDENRATLAVQATHQRAISEAMIEELAQKPGHSVFELTRDADYEDPRLASSPFINCSKTEKLLRELDDDYATPSAELFLRHDNEDISPVAIYRRLHKKKMARIDARAAKKPSASSQLPPNPFKLYDGPASAS